MQLRSARLCLDCEEIHDRSQCPLCTSETFASISRWIPAPDRRTRPRHDSNPQVESNPRVEAYRALTDKEARPSNAGRRLKQGVLGLTALGVIGWFIRPPRSRP